MKGSKPFYLWANYSFDMNVIMKCKQTDVRFVGIYTRRTAWNFVMKRNANESLELKQ